MITTTDPELDLLLSNFMQKVHIEYVKPDFDAVNDSIISDNPKVDISYTYRVVVVDVELEVSYGV
jgi:hypothetical protein